MKRKIAIVTGTRAEYGLLKNLIERVHVDSDLELQLYVTGTHLSKSHGSTYKEIEADGLPIHSRIEMDLQSAEEVDVLGAMSQSLQAFGKAFSQSQPDLLVFLGDRFEILVAAQAALILKIPMAHIHGGETSEGAIDEAIRHSLTKMSHLHFVSAEDYRKRVIQLGEHPNRVFCVGAPGLDNIKQIDFESRVDLEAHTGLQFDQGLFVVTFHPMTLSGREKQLESVHNLIKALDSFPSVAKIITLPNADPQAQLIADAFIEYGKSRDRVFVTPSLGYRRYLSAVKLALAVVGNSSSGLIEAPFLKVPTVNIGDRQKGRLRGDSVIQCLPSAQDIENALRRALSPEFKKITQQAPSLFGEGEASGKIFKVIKDHSLDGILMKSFYDIVP